ncbi:MAG TPA: hypothetical protein VFM38_02150 [Candidatus Limnocylindrales bacterium]|nr:hypothetical protein [Candidatus Limnocylindrales bacterium]
MHLIGARFRTLAAATMALQAIRAGVPVAPGDIAVRPLGSTRYERPAEDFLLAGRFESDDVDAVVDIVLANGGRLLERRVEVAGTSTSVSVEPPVDERAAGRRRARTARGRAAHLRRPRVHARKRRRPVAHLRDRAAHRDRPG